MLEFKTIQILKSDTEILEVIKNYKCMMIEYKNFFKWLEITYRIDINSELRNTLTEHFGEILNIYTDQDLYEQSRKIIQTYKDKYISNNKYYKYGKHL